MGHYKTAICVGLAGVLAGIGFWCLDADNLKSVCIGGSLLIAVTAALFMLINPRNE